MKDYQPIQCELHDGYELACMRRAEHIVSWHDDAGEHIETLRFMDIEVSNSEEYLIADTPDGEKRRIRLDLISSSLPY
ncbi:Rho-binding antiterminator [Aliamphritea hakodatensis]|uniref:Rho-binding antiterminator n=1 Tax=Aliamphritea hakodatensis TaxID=2895352 RepID=UPI0022FD997A|nr:Rho-binding antiterminator [Aliamphritea hakodatensis]